MVLRLVQFRTQGGARAVAALGNDTHGQIVQGVATTYDLAWKAVADGASLAATVEKLGLGDTVDIRAALA